MRQGWVGEYGRAGAFVGESEFASSSVRRLVLSTVRYYCHMKQKQRGTDFRPYLNLIFEGHLRPSKTREDDGQLTFIFRKVGGVE